MTLHLPWRDQASGLQHWNIRGTTIEIRAKQQTWRTVHSNFIGSSTSCFEVERPQRNRCREDRCFWVFCRWFHGIGCRSGTA